MISRRDLFTRATGLGLGSGVLSLGASAPAMWRRAAADAEARADLPILVVIELTGGNDGLNTVVPYADDIYHRNRPTLRIEPTKVLKLDDRVSLHPALKELHQFWDSGDLAVIQGVGYPNPNRSHFRSMEIWQTGVIGPAPVTGWLGRAADAKSAIGLCHVGTQSAPLALQGRTIVPQSLSSLADYRLADGTALVPEDKTGRPDDRLLDQVRTQYVEARRLSARLAALRDDKPISPGDIASSESLEGRLETVRRLIEVDIPLRVYYTTQDGFDTHAGQRFSHHDLLRRVSQAVSAFLTRLKTSRLDERVVVLLFSEFGRRLKENGSQGTDHGTAAPILLAGRPVKGGVIGLPPNLSQLDDAGDPAFTTDFRDVYATLLEHWLAVDPEPILSRRSGSVAALKAR